MLAHETIYHTLETRYSILVEAGTFHITATAATPEQARMLNITSGASLLLIQRVSCTTGDIPVYVQERYYRSDRVSYRVALRRHGDALGGVAALRELRPVFSDQSSAQENT